MLFISDLFTDLDFRFRSGLYLVEMLLPELQLILLFLVADQLALHQFLFKLVAQALHLPGADAVIQFALLALQQGDIVLNYRRFALLAGLQRLFVARQFLLDAATLFIVGLEF